MLFLTPWLVWIVFIVVSVYTVVVCCVQSTGYLFAMQTKNKKPEKIFSGFVIANSQQTNPSPYCLS
jgi:hypothetical protein